MNAAIYGADGFFTGQFIGGPTAEYIERMTPAGFFAWVYDGPSLDVRRYRVDHGQLVEHIPEAPMETDDLTWIWEPAVWRWVGVPTPAAVFRARRTAMADAVLQEITTAEARQARPVRELLDALLTGQAPAQTAVETFAALKAEINGARARYGEILAAQAEADLDAIGVAVAA